MLKHKVYIYKGLLGWLKEAMLRPKRFILLALMILVLVSWLTSLTSVSALRLTNRSLKIESAKLGVSTTYTISFGFPSNSVVGSVKMEFCDDAVPYLPCHSISGLDVSGATLTSQTGEAFSITSQTTNSIILSRPASVPGHQVNSYVFENAVNPDIETTFYVRLTSYASSDASGNYIDYGGVVSATTKDIILQTQVPPLLTFCVSLLIADYNCMSSSVGGGNYVDFGNLDSDTTYATQSQFTARTNARNGYSVSVYGIGFTAGNKIIPSLEVPTPSATGNSQFGMNLTANSSPAIGVDQNGPGLPAVINADYLVPDQFVYHSGDTLVSVAGATSFTRYTASYILNVSPDQPPGKYGTTITYICTGHF